MLMIINENLTMVNSGRQLITLNKPVYTGFAILELAKLKMYEFLYEVLLPSFPLPIIRSRLLNGH